MTGPVTWLAKYARETPDAPFLGTTSGWVTYAQMQSLVNGVRALLASLGVGPGSRVVLALPNVAGTVACWLAVQSLGATSVELDREWSEAALAEVVKQAKPALAIISGRDAKKWARPFTPGEGLPCLVMHPTPPPEPLRALLGERYLGWLSEEGTGEPLVLPAPEVREPEVAQIVFTSGTTSAPRGVLQTTKNLCVSTDGIVEYLQLTRADRAMLVLPLFYVYGKSVLLSHLRVGGSVFMDHRFMYPRVVMEAIGTERCTNLAGVPLTFESLRRQVDLSTVDLSSLRFVTQAGGPMQQDTITWARTAFSPAPLYVMYGQTEATSRLSYLPPAWAPEKQGSIGRGMPGVELRVVDEQGTPVPPGVEGQLVARGEVVMPGYLDAPEETAKVLRDGWLWTGDLATWDSEGFVFITGRAKQVLKLGGHRVAPAELEHALTARAGVREAVVVGAPDGLEGEVAIAFVISDDARLDQSVLLRHCRSLLPAQRVPRRVVLVPDFPRNTSGKVLLGELKKLAAALHFAEMADRAPSSRAESRDGRPGAQEVAPPLGPG
ncbi:MAG: class I adenylate-forming enzyme family protein [Archangium sp.]|nr:class I adenylate-forming enzyme family protein [Archangium sp.]